jgi:hypothetical protein
MVDGDAVEDVLVTRDRKLTAKATMVASRRRDR